MTDRKDDFWDIASLLPKKQTKIKSTPYGEVETTPVTDVREEVLDGERSCDAEARKIHKDTPTDKGEADSYTPKENPFISRVRVIERKSHMRLFHGFKSDGAAWLSKRGTPCPYAPYFSFVPQYEQLNAAQRAYYLYFRDSANSGMYLDAGQSYVLLYIYEILNLPEYIPPKIGILRLAKVWSAYRKSMPILDKNLIPWLADYGLLHGVGCPREILSPFLNEILAKSNLKEFYLGFDEKNAGGMTDALILLTSQYRYENSRYATGENKALFQNHIRSAASTVLRHIFLDGGKLKYQTVTKRMDAFTGALWAGTNRYELEVTYYSVTGTDDLKITMTAVVKYSENKLRAYLGVKSRLSVSCLPDRARSLVDAYFERALPKKTEREAVARPEYEAMYDPLSVGVSTEEAKEIEQSSWENTWLLIPDAEKEEIFSDALTASTAIPVPDAPAPEAHRLTKSQSVFLSHLLSDDQAAARQFAREVSISYLTLGESVNEFFADTLGDTVLDLLGEEYTVVSDYEDEIRAAICAANE